MDLLRVSLQACHSVTEKSSRQDVKVAFPGLQSQCPPAGVVKGRQHHQRSMTLELQVLFSLGLKQDLMGPPTCSVTMDDSDPPASTTSAGLTGVSHHPQMSHRPLAFPCVSSRSSCLVGRGGSRDSGDPSRWRTETQYPLGFRCCTDVWRGMPRQQPELRPWSSGELQAWKSSPPWSQMKPRERSVS